MVQSDMSRLPVPIRDYAHPAPSCAHPVACHHAATALYTPLLPPSLVPLLPPFTTCTPTCNLYPAPSCALCRHMHCTVVCIVPSCALRRRVPLHCCRPLHAAAALYTPLLPPSTCCHRRPLYIAVAALSMPPPLPLCTIAGLTTGCCLYVWHHPCPWPSCTCHVWPGPLGVHIAIACVSPVSTPLTWVHAPPLCSPRISALSLAPSAAVPHVSAPIACALASQVSSAAMPCVAVSAPIACALASQAPSMAVPHISAPVACALTS